MKTTKNRLIATLLVSNGVVVQTRKFKRTNMVGNAFTAVDFFNGWAVDEIIVLEISNSRDYLEKFVEIVHELSRRCFVPLTVGGKINDLSMVNLYIRSGADKVIVNTNAVTSPQLIRDIVKKFGSQCCVISIDAKSDRTMPSHYQVVINNGRQETQCDVLAWAQQVESFGAGEIMVNNVDYDGNKCGYDLNLVRLLSDALKIPVIAMGGVGQWDDFVACIKVGHADAVAAGNIFHYTEHSTKKAKEYMQQAGLFVRHSAFYKVNMPRKQKYRPFQ